MPPTPVSALGRRAFLSAAGALTMAPLFASKARAENAGDSAERHPLLITQHSQIARSRDAALAELQPTKAQLEQGLEIHQRALVFDAYGFAPRAALDAARVSAAIEEGASAAELRDLREELGMTQAALVAAERLEFAEAMRCAGVTSIFQNAGEEGSDPLRLLKR